MSHRVEICGVDTARLPKLSNIEILELMKRIKRGDDAAKEEFIWGNMRLVLSIVQRFSSAREVSDDLFQVGCVGLLKSIKNFDTSLNVMFSTYAVPMIIGEIRRYLRDGNSIKVSRRVRDIAYRALHAREQMIKSGNAEPQMFEIAKEIDMPIRDVSAALDAVSEPVSLFERVYGDGDDSITLVEQIYDTKHTDTVLLENFSLRDSMNKIPEREKEVITLRYFLGKTQIEISEAVGISQAQVSRLEKSGLSKLKKYLAES